MRRGRSILPRLLLLLSSLDMRAAVHRKAVRALPSETARSAEPRRGRAVPLLAAKRVAAKPGRRVALISLTGPQRQVSRMGRRPHAAEDGDEWSSANGYDLPRT